MALSSAPIRTRPVLSDSRCRFNDGVPSLTAVLRLAPPERAELATALGLSDPEREALAFVLSDARKRGGAAARVPTVDEDQ